MKVTVLARENPFATQRMGGLWYRWPEGFRMDKLLVEWRAQNCYGAIVAPCGSGKTTLLDAIEQRFQQEGIFSERIEMKRGEGWFGLQQWKQIISAWRNKRVILLDGAEQLWGGRVMFWGWRKLSGPKLLITSHEELLLPTIYVAQTSALLLRELVQAMAAEVEMSDEEWESLYRRHECNLRLCLLELYDRYAAGEFSVGARLNRGI